MRFDRSMQKVFILGAAALVLGLTQLFGGADETGDTKAAKSGQFDYYLLALSWSPSYCIKNRQAEQCGQGYRFVLHGLWPQYAKGGWPAHCVSRSRPDRSDMRSMLDIMPDEDLFWHQWAKHGTCSGLKPVAYFAHARQAFEALGLPVLENPQASPRAIEHAFMAANPGLDADEVTVHCRSGRLHEVRICLSKDLKPRRCSHDTIKDCGTPGIKVPQPQL